MPWHRGQLVTRLACIAAGAALVACAAPPRPDDAPPGALPAVDPDHAVQVLLAAMPVDARFLDQVAEYGYRSARVGHLCRKPTSPLDLRLRRARVDAYFLTLEGVRANGTEQTDLVDLQAIRDPGAGARAQGTGPWCFGFQDAGHHRAYIVYVPSEGAAQNAVAALQALSSAAPAARSRMKRHSRALSRSTAPPRSTPPTEDIHRIEVQAGAAINAHQFQQAQVYYAEGTEMAPWYAPFHFNRALLLGDTLGAPHVAIVEMQRYLALAGDAPNARAAQDKIYVWQTRLH